MLAHYLEALVHTTFDPLSAIQNVPVRGSTGDTPVGVDKAVSVAVVAERMGWT